MADSTKRNADLRKMLSDRRRDLQREVHHRIRDRRTDRTKEVGDDIDESDANVQRDIDLALLQMRAQTVTHIDAMLTRLEAGQYGRCVECERAIAGRRLQALPFALRCQACEERREQKQETGRLAKRATEFCFFPEVAGS